MKNKEIGLKVKQIATELIYEKGYLSPVEVLLKLDYLSISDYEAWRFGNISYLEKACMVNLNKLSLINREIKKVAAVLKLENSWTAYKKFGKGAKPILQFSKSGDKKIEEAYATHYVDKQRMTELRKKDESITPEYDG